jgi:hypothetical protein
MRKQAVIGLIGGMSWESFINREVRNRLGGVHSAQSAVVGRFRRDPPLSMPLPSSGHWPEPGSRSPGAR